jgi:pimeloyl-ACP methyl ester carboxylesterase
VIKKMVLGFLALLLVAFSINIFFYLDFRSDRLAHLKSTSQIIETAVGPIEYQIMGDSGPLVLFLHGTPGGYDQALPVEGLRVLGLSRPGFLRTPIEVGRTPQEQAQAYAALLDAMNIEKIIVLGVSGGGPSSLSFAANYPERVLGLIELESVSQSIGFPDMPFFVKSDYLMWSFLSSLKLLLGTEGLVTTFVPDPANQQRILEDDEKLASMEDLMWSSWPVSLRQAGTDNDFENFSDLDLPVGDIVAPTLIIHGTADRNVPYEQSVWLADQIPGAKLISIEGADHMLPISHSDEMFKAIEQFIEKLDLE